MKQIKIIDNVFLANDGVLRTHHVQKVHLRQGELDGACAVYSMMMCLIIEKIISRRIIKNPPKELKRSTSEGRLVRSFLEKQGMVVNGYELEKLHEDLQSAFRSKVDSIYFNSNTNIIEEIKKCLEDNHPVEVAFNYMRGKSGHAVVAIGYQDDNNKTLLYCLDPAYPMDECQMWNNVLEIDKTKRATYNCHNLREDFSVTIDEILYFLKK